ncbi:MAG TPA: outer membrane lipoprotein-sorting protein [Chromatiales bacterium]|nr:outer membrane lipoprotein-sorting protein [Chromatiales bacterium]
MPSVTRVFVMGIALILGGYGAGMPQALASGEEKLTGKEIFERCGYKYPGEDQRSKFTVMLRDRQGNVKKSEYLRFWKDFKGKEGVSDKMLLFTIYPPDARGAAFMRVAYTRELNKVVDQWIYLPVLKKIRRVSIRDPGDNFLNSNLTYADVSKRALEDDDHKYLGTKNVKGLDFYMVESTPRESRPLYSKRIFWFLKTPDWEDCVNTRIDYYDTKGALLKEQFIKWQKIDNAWIWDRVLVRSRQDLTASVFQISEVEINTDLSDDVFSARTLRKGPDAIPKLKRKPRDRGTAQQ